MVEIDSKWILQEVFVHPGVESGELEGILTVEIFSDCRKEGELRKVVVEITGGVFDDGRQIANIRFVNVSKFEFKGKKSALLKRVVDSKLSELLSFLPMYLVKSGIFVKGVSVEM